MMIRSICSFSFSWANIGFSRIATRRDAPKTESPTLRTNFRKQPLLNLDGPGAFALFEEGNAKGMFYKLIY